MTDLRDILYPTDPHQPQDAYVSARQGMKKALPKRFYAVVSIEDGEAGHQILLDGKRARTPARHLLALPSRAAAECVAAEWEAQVSEINPADMHATRITNIGIDRVNDVRDEVIAEIAKYATTDLVCYRAAAPAELVARESALWDRVLDHVRQAHGARFVLSQGVGFAAQEPAAIAAVATAAARVANPVALAALQTLVTIAGSALIAIAFVDGVLTAEDAFAAACVEEDWNAQLWGADEEVEFRRARRWAEFSAAAALFRALQG